MTSDDGTTKPGSLRSLGGEEPTPELTLGLKDLALLPEGARQHFWEALGPSLKHPLPPNLDERLNEFQRVYEAPEGRLARAIKACRQLYREAGRHLVSREQFERDLAALEGVSDEVTALLLSGFERAMAAMRQEILYGTLVDHGKLLVGVDWRVDSMLLSHRGQGLQSPVALVTLRYIEGGEHRRVTLQALPDMLQELRAMCEQILD